MFATACKTLPCAKSLAFVKQQIQDLGISGNCVPIHLVRDSDFNGITDARCSQEHSFRFCDHTPEWPGPSLTSAQGQQNDRHDR
jgi:hypothetical protein